MRYTKDHKEKTRRALVAAGGRLMKERGLAGVGVDQIMGSAGLTGAAMYNHFDSKAAMLLELLDAELERSVALFDKADAAGGMSPQAWAAGVLREYLSLAHARNPAQGCALPALSQELARQDGALQAAFGRTLERIIDIIALRTERPDLAPGILAAAVGAVSLARALPNDADAKSMLCGARSLIEEMLATPRRP